MVKYADISFRYETFIINYKEDTLRPQNPHECLIGEWGWTGKKRSVSTQWPSRAPFLHPTNELLSPRGESSEERVCADQMCISQMVTGEYVIIPQWRTFPNLAAKAMGEDKVLGSAQSLRVFKFFRGSGSMKETLPPQKGGPEKEGEP